jgi:hypothetical protein
MSLRERITNLKRDWKYDSEPGHFLGKDKIFRAGWGLVMPKAPRLHEVDWQNIPMPERFKGIALTSGLSDFQIPTPIHHFMASDLGKWENSFNIWVAEPDKYPTEYMQIGFIPENLEFIRMCKVKFNPYEILRVLIGPNPAFYCARSKEGLWLPLEGQGPFHRNDPELKDFILI